MRNLAETLRQKAAERGYSDADGGVVLVAVFCRNAAHFTTRELRRAGLDHEVIGLPGDEPPAVEASAPDDEPMPSADEPAIEAPTPALVGLPLMTGI